MNRIGRIFILISLLAVPLRSGVKAGLYFSLAGSYPSRLYIQGEPFSLHPSENPVSGNLSLFISLYQENTLEMTLSLIKENYHPPDREDILHRYAFAFEAGKLFTLPLGGENRILSSDVGCGLFVLFSLFSERPYNRVFTQYGFYGSFKLRMNSLARWLKLSSFDVGYKYLIPIRDQFYDADNQLLISRHHLFFGVSF